MVMIGSTSRELIRAQSGPKKPVRKRYIRIKHHSDLQVAYEYDPFVNDEDLLVEGDEAYRLFIGAERGQTRHPCPPESNIRVHTNLGDGGLVNYSDRGFTIKLHNYYAVGVIINMSIDTPDGYLGEQLHGLGVENIVLEVRWARPTGDSFMHGCMIKNMSDDQCNAIVSILSERFSRDLIQTAISPQITAGQMTIVGGQELLFVQFISSPCLSLWL